MKDYIERKCKKHGLTRYIVENRGVHRCVKCRTENVSKRRKKVKEILVAEHGGKCIKCGYNRFIGSLQFHHRDPSQKKFGIAKNGSTIALDRMREEAKKCDLLCANCHFEVEGNFIPA